MTGRGHPAPRDSMANVFTRRLRAASGIADVLSPAQVRTFSDCEVRWFYQHLLGLSDPLTSVLALDKAIRTALLTNFRHKLESKQDIEIEGVVGLFRRTWEQQQASAMFCEDEIPEAVGRTGEELVRIYMQQGAPQIRPASIKQPFQGVLGMVRILGQLDVMDEDGAIIDIRTVRTAAARIDHGVRFELATCARLAEGASGVVRSHFLVMSNTPQHVAHTWEVTAADIRWMDELFPLAQEAIRRGYYMPNRNSIHCSRHQCPYWRRCEGDFGGVVDS